MAEENIPSPYQAVEDDGSGHAHVLDMAPNNNQSRQNNREGGRYSRWILQEPDPNMPKRKFTHKIPWTEREGYYHQDDIHTHFWGKEIDPRVEHGATLHGSKAHPESLSYVIAYSRANPRWETDHIIFAKSKLQLLPDYEATKAEHGEWDAVGKADTSSKATTDYKVTDAPNEPDATCITPLHSHGVKAEMQPGGSTSAEDQSLSHSSVDKPSDGKDATAPIDATNPAAGDVDQARAIKTPESMPSLVSVNDDQEEQSASIKGAEENKQEGQMADACLKGVGTDAGCNTAISTPSSASAGRLAHTDIRENEEKGEKAQAASQSIGSDSHDAKHTDPDAVVSTGSGPSDSSNEANAAPCQPPCFAAMPPIDYVPAATSTIPVAVFEEYDSTMSFVFKGWFKVSRVNLLAPRSAELVRMLQQKWVFRDCSGHIHPSKPRSVSAWNTTLGMEWAVVRFEALSDAPPAPQIEKLPRPGGAVDGGAMNKENRKKPTSRRIAARKAAPKNGKNTFTHTHTYVQVLGPGSDDENTHGHDGNENELEDENEDCIDNTKRWVSVVRTTITLQEEEYTRAISMRNTMHATSEANFAASGGVGGPSAADLPASDNGVSTDDAKHAAAPDVKAE